MKSWFFIFSIILTLFFFLAFPKTAIAVTLFEDNFDNGLEKWEAVRGDINDWTIQEGKVGAVVSSPGTIIEVIPKADFWDDEWGDYIFEVDMFPKQGIDKNVSFRFQDIKHWYEIHHTTDKYGYKTIYLSKVGNGGNLAAVRFPLYNDSSYHIKIVLKADNIKVFIRNLEAGEEQLVIDYNDVGTSLREGKIGLKIGTGAVYPSEVWFDNVMVTAIDEEEEKEPVVLLPGLGGSWNHQEIFFGIDQPQSAWYKTPFVNTYNGLIQTLQNADYTLGENLFVFYYDWFQPITQSATDLKNYISTVVKAPPGTEVDLIGHSLGGLVARTYVQDNPGSHGVNQLITLGSPHKGAPQTYRAWEGADLYKLLGSGERIGAGILLRLRGFRYPNLVQAIRNLAPSLGNLLFIDDYLKWNDSGTVKSESTMSQQNNWLKDLGISSELLGLANTIVGTAGDTPRWLRIIERTQIDKILGRWEDGKPVAEESAIGDRIVLEESAKLTEANIITLAGLDHGDLVQTSTGLEKILELLGFSGVEIVEQPEIPFEPGLIFTVASPATLRVTDPLGRQVGAGIDPSEIPDATFYAQEKIIIIPQAMDGEYKAEVLSEDDGGSYQLLIGQLTQNQDIWSIHQDEVEPDAPDTYELPFDDSLQVTDTYLVNLINSKLKDLLQQIRHQKIRFWIKVRLSTKIFRILARTRSLPRLLKRGRNKLAIWSIQKAILKTTEAINYAEKFNPDSLPPLREILDLLGQLHQLLES